MKEATGELNMTVITIILIGVVLGFFYLIWDNIKSQINNEWNKATEKGPNAYNVEENSHTLAIAKDNTTYTITW